MAIYVPRHFACEDPAVARAIVQGDPFATLVTADTDEPWITHLPLTWADGESFLMGHLARANGHSRLLCEAHQSIAIFHGPHTYITPSAYVTPNQVPTWNYAVAHIHGVPETLSHEDAIQELQRLARAFDPNLRYESDQISGQAKGIVAFRLHISKVELKLKMSQNKPVVDREVVIAELQARGDRESLRVADWVARLLADS